MARASRPRRPPGAAAAVHSVARRGVASAATGAATTRGACLDDPDRPLRTAAPRSPPVQLARDHPPHVLAARSPSGEWERVGRGVYLADATGPRLDRARVALGRIVGVHAAAVADALVQPRVGGAALGAAALDHARRRTHVFQRVTAELERATRTVVGTARCRRRATTVRRRRLPGHDARAHGGRLRVDLRAAATGWSSPTPPPRRGATAATLERARSPSRAGRRGVARARARHRARRRRSRVARRVGRAGSSSCATASRRRDPGPGRDAARHVLGRPGLGGVASSLLEYDGRAEVRRTRDRRVHAGEAPPRRDRSRPAGASLRVTQGGPRAARPCATRPAPLLPTELVRRSARAARWAADDAVAEPSS